MRERKRKRERKRTREIEIERQREKERKREKERAVQPTFSEGLDSFIIEEVVVAVVVIFVRLRIKKHHIEISQIRQVGETVQLCGIGSDSYREILQQRTPNEQPFESLVAHRLGRIGEAESLQPFAHVSEMQHGLIRDAAVVEVEDSQSRPAVGGRQAIEASALQIYSYT